MKVHLLHHTAQFCLSSLLLLAAGCGMVRPTASNAAVFSPSSSRPSSWAQPLSVAGLPNLHQVNDVLYRSAQPTAEGYFAARQLGIRSVLRLRAAQTPDDDLASIAGLTVYDLPFQAWNINDDVVVRAMRILRPAEQNGPFLVHCLHGADRTGLITAIYRMLWENWPTEDAITELTEGGFGFHPVFVNIPHYLRGLNLEELRAKVLEGK